MFKAGGLDLKINTTAANASSAQPATAGGLFGGSNTQSTGQTGGGLFGNTQTQQQGQQTGGLFGGSTTTGGGGLFGNAQQQQKPAGGLFGGAAPAQPQQQQTGGGLFGGAATATQTQPQQQTGGGLFGASTTTQTQPQTGGGLFGASTTQAQPQQTGGGLFGGSTAQAQPQQQAGGGMFGAAPRPQATGTGMFGQAQAKPSLFGQAAPAQQTAGLTMGQSTTQQTVPGVRIDLANVRGTTKFSDLTPELQREIEGCDNIIQIFKSHADQIAQFRAGHKGDLERLTHDVGWLQRKFDGVKTTLEDDVKVVANLKDLIKSDADIAKAAFKGAEQLKLPAHYHTTWLTASKPAEKTPQKDEADPDLEDCITLFSKEAERLNELHRFQVQKIREMELHMPGVENGLYERMRALRDGAPQFPAFGYAVELLDVTKALGDEIVRSASVIIDTREKLNELQLRPLPHRK